MQMPSIVLALSVLTPSIGASKHPFCPQCMPWLSAACPSPELSTEHCAMFCSLEELLKPELRGGKYSALDLRRVALVLDKYRELDRASGYASMHKSRQAEVGGRLGT